MRTPPEGAQAHGVVLEFRVLGPLTVRRSGSELRLPGPRPRLVLARLLLSAGRMVPASRLVADVWGVQDRRTGALRTTIWQLRRALRTGGGPDGETVLVSCAGGYLLDIQRDQVDATRFEALFARARACATSGARNEALAHLDRALDLWHGPAFGDLATVPCVRGDATRLEELLLAVKELRAELLLIGGHHAESVAELTPLTRDHPERERIWALLMTALYRSGRQADALRCFQEARARLTEDMGIEPSQDLRALEQAVLRQDPALDTGLPHQGRYGG